MTTCEVCGAEDVRCRGRCGACYERRRRAEHDESRRIKAAERAITREQERELIRRITRL